MAIARTLLLAAAACCLLAVPSLAQSKADPPAHGGGTSGGGHGMTGGGMHGPIGGTPHGAPGGFVQSHGRSYYVGGPRGPVEWGQFHHNATPARAFPHRYGGTNFPRPNAWHGNFHDFEIHRWQGGHWYHSWHAGRFGWWWAVGLDWYFYDEPVYPYPDLYTPLGEPFGWWYWCDPYQEYYPFVTYCPVEWESVLPRD